MKPVRIRCVVTCSAPDCDRSTGCTVVQRIEPTGHYGSGFLVRYSDVRFPSFSDDWSWTDAGAVCPEHKSEKPPTG